MLQITSRTLPVWIIIGACIAFLFLSSCSSEQAVRLPEGPQTVIGMLRPVPLSRLRRGTHAIIQDDDTIAYAESTTVTLRQYEGETVALQGTYEANINAGDLPVLVVTEIVSKQDVKVTRLPTLRLHLDVPSAWSYAASGTGAIRFTASGSTQPVLTIAKTSLQSLPAGSPVIVDGERGSRVIPAGGSDQMIYVLRGKEVYSFAFTPGATIDPLLAAPLFLKVLRSVGFDGKTTAPSSARGSGATIQGEPCGGLAGILCPQGEFCSILDPDTNSGICVKRR